MSFLGGLIQLHFRFSSEGERMGRSGWMLMRMMMERGKDKEREGGRRREFNHHFRRPSSRRDG